MNKNITYHETIITKDQRAKQKNQKPFVIWLTGLSGSGKSTIANNLEKFLFDLGYHTFILDGDNLRYGLNEDLKFDQASRTENIRRVAHVLKLFLEAGIIVITAFISPFKKDRDFVRELLEDEEFIEVFLDISLKECISRDPKGLYKKHKNGKLLSLTGIDSPYEKPLSPDIHITESDDKEKSLKKIKDFLKKKEYINV